MAIGKTHLDPSYFGVQGGNLYINNIFNGASQQLLLLNSDILALGGTLTAAQADAALTTFTSADFAFPAAKLTKQAFLDAGMSAGTLEADIVSYLTNNAGVIFGGPIQLGFNLIISFPSIGGTDYVFALAYPGNSSDVVSSSFAKFSAVWKRSPLTVSPDQLDITNSQSDWMYNIWLDKGLTIADGGKYVVEFQVVQTGSFQYFGATYLNSDPVSPYNDGQGWPLLTHTAGGIYWAPNDAIYTNLAVNSGVNGPGPVVSGDKIAIAIDLVNMRVWIGKNGTFIGNPATNSGGASFSPTTTKIYLGVAMSSGEMKIVTPTTIPAGFVQL